MIATTVCMGTVCPSFTLIFFTTPAEGDGISASTLSVEISNSGSSRSILSPAFFSHLVMVPSKILSPIWGMMTSTAMVFSSGIEFWPAPAANLEGRFLRRQRSDLMQALFVPHAGNSFQRINLIAASEKIHFLHLGGASGIFHLLGLKIMVVLARLEDMLEERTIGDVTFAAHFKFCLVDAFRLSHR